MISPKPHEESRFSVTAFNGFFDTVPLFEALDISWREFVALVAPADGAALAVQKESASYTVPCGLRVAPYTGKTLERAKREGWPSLSGKQRSAAHCMASAILKYDLDGMADEDWASVLAALNASGLTFLDYSTWSYGLKPGVRVRVFVPLDRELDQPEYEAAWFALAEIIFPELLGGGRNIIDLSARKICQQQSVWCAPPDRAHLAFRHRVTGGVASADALIAMTPKREAALPPRGTVSVSWTSSATPDITRLRAAHGWIDPDNHEVWVKTGHCYKALCGVLGEGAAFELWRDHGARGSNTAKNDSSHSPEKKWATFSPTMTPETATATLLSMARDCARGVLAADIRCGALSERGKLAAVYLAKHHKKLFDQLKDGTI